MKWGSKGENCKRKEPSQAYIIYTLISKKNLSLCILRKTEITQVVEGAQKEGEQENPN